MKKSILVITLFFAFQTLNAQSITNKEAKNMRKKYAKMLQKHPVYKQLMHEAKEEAEQENEKDKKPENDRPDLDVLRDYVMTMDVTTGKVPGELLYKANAIADEFKKQSKSNARAQSVAQWEERGPSNIGGRTRALLFDLNDATHKKVWAGSVGGGLWYNNNITSTDSSWHHVDDFWDNLAVSSLAADAANPNTMFAGTGEGFYNLDARQGYGVWKTTNGGATWANLPSTINFRNVQRIAVTGGNIYLATRDNGLQQSSDGGTTWTQVLPGNICDLKVGSDGTIYAAAKSDAIYSSTTGNAGTWTNLGFPKSGVGRIGIACAPSNANVIYALVDSSYRVGHIYKSVNKGATWADLNKPADADGGIPSTDFSRTQAWYDLAIAVDPNNAQKIVVGGVDLFTTSDDGANWTQLSHWYGGFGFQFVHADQHAIVFAPGSSDRLVFGNDGGVFLSDNLSTAATIDSKNHGYNVTQYYSGAIYPTAGSDYMLAGAQDNGTQQYTTPGINSTTAATNGDGAFCFIDQDDPNYQVTSYIDNNYYISTDGGLNFNVLSSNSTGSFINPTDYDSRENILYSGESSTTLQRISFVTSSPVVESINVNVGTTTSAIKVSSYAPIGQSTIFVGTQAGNVYKVTNANGTPTTNDISGNITGGNISSIELGADENQIIITCSNYGVISVWETRNGGANWVNKEGNLPNMPVRWAVYDPTNYQGVLAATESGVWITDDITASPVVWTPSNNGLANVRVDMLKYRKSDGTIMAATHGRGVFTHSNPFNHTSSGCVASITSSVIPATICQGDSVTLTASAGVSYSWSNSSVKQSITVKTGGSYTVTVTDNSACTAKASKTVVVNALPTTPTISRNGNTLSTAAGAQSYKWYFNNTLIGGAANNTYTATQNGSYKVVITNASGCSATSNPFTVVLVVGIADVNDLNNRKTFPNPFVSDITIKGLNVGKPNKIKIVNVSGVVVKEFEASTQSGDYNVNLSAMANGVYFIKCNDDEMIKVMKQN